jgi:hypothetical protein
MVGTEEKQKQKEEKKINKVWAKMINPQWA